jgi:hypothetical protein
MRERRVQFVVPLTVAIVIAGCNSALSPTAGSDLGSPLPLSRSPDLTAVVTKDTVEAGYSPGWAGGWRSQYDLWLAVAPSPAANAGAVLGAATPVFVSSGGVLSSATAASIRIGDVIQLWHDAGSVYGAAQAPPGAPAYASTQVVILR